MKDRAGLMRVYLSNNVKSLSKMREHYNSFDEGGEVDNVNTTDAQDYVASWLSQRQEQLRENVRQNSQRFLLPKSWSNKATFNEYQRQLKNLQSVKQYDVLGNTSFPQAPKEEWEAVKRLTTNVGGAYNPKTHSISYINPTNTTDIHELTHSLDADPQINAVRYPNIQGEKLREGVKYNSYYDSAPEIYPRLMEFRKNFNLDPKRIYTPEDIKKFREKYDPNNILNRYSDEYIEYLLNNVASTKDRDSVKNIAADGGELSSEWDSSHIKKNKINLDYLYNQHRDSGLSHNQTIALLSNYVVESGIDPLMKQRGGGTGEGLIQFTDPSRKNNLSKFQPIHDFDGAPSPELQRQARYITENIGGNLRGEWRHGGATNHFNKASEAREAFYNEIPLEDLTTIVSENYVRPGKPHLDRRKEVANYLNTLYFDNPVENIFRKLGK